MAANCSRLIRLCNFLSFKEEQEIDIPKLNEKHHGIVTGENGCGKTNLVRAIQFVVNHWRYHHIEWKNSGNAWDKNEASHVIIQINLHGEDLAVFQAYLNLCALRRIKEDKIKAPDSFEIGFANFSTLSRMDRYFNCNSDNEAVRFISQCFSNDLQLSDVPNRLSAEKKDNLWTEYSHLVELVGAQDAVNGFDVIGAILRRRVAFVREGRGLLQNELDGVTFDLQTTAFQLYKYKNGNEEQLAKLAGLKKCFRKFFPNLTPDVHSEIYEMSGDRLQVQPRIIYRGNNDKGPFHVSVWHSSGGMNDVLMLLAAMYLGDVTVLVLDEISRSLHPTLKQMVAKITQHAPQGIIMVTHDIEMVNEVTSQNVIRLYKDRRGTFQLPKIEEKDEDKTAFWKFVCDPLRLPAYFARGILFVEGESDVRFCQALLDLVLQEKITVCGVNLADFHFLWEIIPLGGAGNSKFGIKLMNNWEDLPHLFLLDWDNFILSTKKIDGEAPGKPKKKVQLTWEQVNWNDRKRVLFHHLKEEFKLLHQDDKPATWQDMYNDFINDERFQAYFLWPMDVFDLEGVCGGLKKSKLANMPFADLQDRIIEILKKGDAAAKALIAFVERLVSLHNKNNN